MKIVWNKVTWYSIALTVVVLIVALVLGFSFVQQYEQVTSEQGAYESSAQQAALSLASSKKLITRVTYACRGQKTIDAAFYQGKEVPVKPGEPPIPTGSATLALSDGRHFNLPQTISADGARYANADESFVFWSKGDGALVLENNVEKNYTNCVAQPNATK